MISSPSIKLSLISDSSIQVQFWSFSSLCLLVPTEVLLCAYLTYLIECSRGRQLPVASPHSITMRKVFHYANKGCQNKQLEWAKKGQNNAEQRCVGMHLKTDQLTALLVSVLRTRKATPFFGCCFYRTKKFLREFHFMVI